MERLFDRCSDLQKMTKRLDELKLEKHLFDDVIKKVAISTGLVNEMSIKIDNLKDWSLDIKNLQKGLEKTN